MKSAYELAMSRLEQQAPSAKLSEEQRAALAEMDSLYRAKIAEREVFLKSQIEVARVKGDATEAEELQTQLGRETRRLQEEWEGKKEAARRG